MNFLKSIRLDKTFRYRDAWLGLAMLLIIMYHSSFRFSFYVLKILKAIGYFGVDICVFATGIGCYYSLEKDPDSLRFLQRRVKRLYPTYLCFVIPWMIWRNTRGSLPFCHRVLVVNSVEHRVVNMEVPVLTARLGVTQ